FETLLRGVERAPGTALSALPLLSDAERAQLAAWNEETRRQRPEESAGQTLHGMFEAQAAKTPGATALIVGEERLTYQDLDRRSADLALRLQNLGPGPEGPVGVFRSRAAHLVFALPPPLGAAGFSFPMDPAYPSERL